MMREEYQEQSRNNQDKNCSSFIMQLFHIKGTKGLKSILAKIFSSSDIKIYEITFLCQGQRLASIKTVQQESIPKPTEAHPAAVL